MTTEAIFQKLIELEAVQRHILAILIARPQVQPRLEDLIDPIVLSKKLRITDRTLRRYRKAGILVPYRFGGTEYYIEAEVIEAMRKHGVAFK